MHLLTAPTTEPVSLAEAKLSARVDGAEFDTLLPGLIAGARAQAEQECGRAWAQQVWRTELADWPVSTFTFNLWRPSLAAVSYWNGSAWVTLATNQYVMAPVAMGVGAIIVPALNVTWPTLPDVAAGPRVRVDLTVGESTAAAVPEGVKTYIKAQVASWLRVPEAIGPGQLQPNPLLGALLDPWRVY